MSTTGPGEIQAMRVNDLYKTLGLNLQTQVYKDASLTARCFNTTGALVFRNPPYVDAASIKVYRQLFNIGCRFIGPSTYASNPVVATDIANLRTIAGMATNAIFAVEGPNEPGTQPITYNGQTSTTANAHPGFEPVVQYTRDVWAAIKADATLGPLSLAMGNSSVSASQAPDNAGFQFLTVPLGANTVTLNTAGSTTVLGNTTLHFTAGFATTGANAVQVGAFIYGSNVAAGAYVAGVSSGAGTVTMSAGATRAISIGTAIRFGCKVADGTQLATICNQHVYPMLQGSQAQFSDTVNGDVIIREAGTEFYQVGQPSSGNYNGYSSIAEALRNTHILSEVGPQVELRLPMAVLLPRRPRARIC